MTTENTANASSAQKSIPFGSRLQAVREEKGLERKDVAAQLRLNEKIIVMMEKNRYPSDLAVTFIRGYLRSYAKFLQIPEHEVTKALEPIKPKPTPATSTKTLKSLDSNQNNNFFMNAFTSLIFFTMIGLVGTWWYSHNKGFSSILAENQITDMLQNPVAGGTASPVIEIKAPEPMATAAKTPLPTKKENVQNTQTQIASAKNINKDDDDDEGDDVGSE